MNKFLLLQDTDTAHRRGIHMYGDYVTRCVWNEVNSIMNDRYMESPAYKARNECTAFFQGGSNDPDGKFIFIEFWNTDKSEAFLKLFNERVGSKIAPTLTELHIDTTKVEKGIDGKELSILIAKEADCSYTIQGDSPIFILRPENNIQHFELWKLIRRLELHPALIER